MQNSSNNVFIDTQVAVIGAGVISCSIAYSLVRRGTSVVVIDANEV